MDVKKVGVIGAGVMGRGVSQNLVESGIDVVLLDVSKGILQQARDEIWNSLRLQKLFRNDSNSEDTGNMIRKIEFCDDYARLSDVDLIIENVTEKWEIKQPVYEKLETLCPDHCVFAANTRESYQEALSRFFAEKAVLGEQISQLHDEYQETWDSLFKDICAKINR